MAEAIAAERVAPIDTVSVESAGVSAMNGMPMTPAAREALAAREIVPGPHGRVGSRALTREMAESADLVLAMTASHADAVLAIAPGANVMLLDPEGHDVIDPFGGSAAEYDETCGLLSELVDARFDEIVGRSAER